MHFQESNTVVHGGQLPRKNQSFSDLPLGNRLLSSKFKKGSIRLPHFCASQLAPTSSKTVFDDGARRSAQPAHVAHAAVAPFPWAVGGCHTSQHCWVGKAAAQGSRGRTRPTREDPYVDGTCCASLHSASSGIPVAGKCRQRFLVRKF